MTLLAAVAFYEKVRQAVLRPGAEQPAHRRRRRAAPLKPVGSSSGELGRRGSQGIRRRRTQATEQSAPQFRKSEPAHLSDPLDATGHAPPVLK